MNVIYVAGANRGCSIIFEANAHLSFKSAFVCMTCAFQTLVSCGNGRELLPPLLGQFVLHLVRINAHSSSVLKA